MLSDPKAVILSPTAYTNKIKATTAGINGEITAVMGVCYAKTGLLPQNAARRNTG
jgi:hypothetical protein